MKYKVIIFDLDGTLFDTRDVMHKSGNYALEKLGLPIFSRERYGLFSGGGIKEFVCGILKAAGQEDCRDYEEFWKLYLEKASELGDEANIPFDNIELLLSKLKEKKIKLAVLSNKDHASCISIIENIFGKDIFDAISGSSLDHPPKPDPYGINKLIDYFRAEKNEVLYIGDGEIDMETAINSNVDVAAALWGFRTKEMLEKYNPTYFLDKPLDILQII